MSQDTNPLPDRGICLYALDEGHESDSCFSLDGGEAFRKILFPVDWADDEAKRDVDMRSYTFAQERVCIVPGLVKVKGVLPRCYSGTTT